MILEKIDLPGCSKYEHFYSDVGYATFRDGNIIYEFYGCLDCVQEHINHIKLLRRNQ